ncbi:tyrosine-protein phosphatase 10D isoform X1 [Trichogramma pretiosum]|uniref:tyrosine-protein phosphatase 10D isoform X1 n=1 Tax=Trichogramma pretiosum TaxID=7493 RepID=UPI0006C975D9|nr:tyrosine-protein phosphatase 10D isoform X1 [Trichogramma pretiosum]
MLRLESIKAALSSDSARMTYEPRCLLLLFLLLFAEVTRSADLAIEIPGNLSQGGATYRLDYTPRVGYPPPNTTIAASDIGDVIKFRDGLPGTRYEYWLFYTNDTLHDWLTWTASITTPPDPPSNLTVQVKSGKSAVVHWDPPRQGNYSGFRLRVQSFNDAGNPWTSVVPADAAPYTLRDLTPGATYSLQLYTVLDTKESVAYTSRNFTAKPNTPGKFIVWFRNETTLLVLWQPPYPPGIYTYYKVSIDPQDAAESVLYIEKESEPPGPAQAAFKGLIPGRAYNISVQTVSEDETSAPTTAQYRTVPLRPLNATFDNSSVTSTSFKVYWQPPNGTSEFDKYQISLAGNRRFSPVTRNREDECKWEFKDLEPGKTYQVVVKTFSGKVSSWPASKDVTLKPLAVRDLHAEVDEKTGMVEVSWIPDNSSTQDSYKIEYHEIEGTIGGDGNVLITNKTRITLEALLPGRNYSICVQAISNKVESNETILYQVTKPSSPIIEDLKSIEKGLNISWKSDVNSRQEKFEVTHNRNDTGESATTLTTESHIMLEDLHPGAGYEVKVFAISHGLRSEPHSYFQAVLPHPPRNLSIEKVTANTVVVHWSAPTDSIFSEYAIRYRTADDPRWVKLPAVKETEAEVTDMSPGERYTIQVNTVSFGVESLYPLNVSHTIRPNPAVNITPVIDSTNVTLEFIRPEGRIEYYVLKWWPAEIPEGMRTKNVTASSLLGYEDPYLGSSVAPVLNPNIERILVDELIPGVEYVFTVYAVSYDLVSDTTSVKTRTMPLIQSEVVVVVDRDQPDSLHLRYTPTPRESSHFDLYRFRISDAVNTTQERTVNDTAKVSFTGLIPGRLYNVTVWTVSENVESRPLIRSDRLYPEPVTAINATEINDTKITLAWDPPRGEYEAFEVQYTNHENVYVQNITTQNGITIEDLRPYRNYTFTVVVRSGSESNYLRHSNPLSASFTTSESYPGRVDKFHPTNVLPSEISFEWSLPASEQNGIIRKFSITYGLEGSTFTQARDFKPTDYRGTIKNLMPGKTYIFRIQAETRVGYGPEVIWKETMQILAPPKPPPQVVPSEVSKTSTTIQIRFRKNYFADANGPVTSYTIIVAEDDSKNASGYEMARWRDVQKYSVWPPYQVIEPYSPFKNGSVEDFTIGTEENCETRQGFCNGPLKPGSTYRVKVRAFTASDKFTDTNYSFPIQTDKDNLGVIVGVIVPILVLICVIILGLIIRSKRRKYGRKTTEARATDDLSLPDSIVTTNRPIEVENFAEHYRLMSADSDFRFSEEFEELKHVGRDQPCSAADLPCNRPKNRFTNILPYDHSRFKLQPVDDEEGSDYINANYVPGHNSPREFIVTQGPLPSTKDDFWRMVWESNSRAIVMLTRCIEKGREKCDHYWPTDTIPVYYGDISVTVLNETHYQDWSITEFMLRKGGESRVIQHFHFTTWPDFGVPSPPQTLVRFVRAFRERVQPDQRPIVVHCSAGVGRSGTFITLDRILQQILVSDYVDIFGIVWAMRKERVWMVQTEQQYICIHQCLLAVLEGLNGGNGPPREIHDNQGFEEKKSSSIGSANSSRVEGENSNANDNENDDENEIDVDDEEDDDDDDDDDGDDDDVDDEVVVNENDSDDEAESATKNITENYTLTIENEKEKSHDIISIKDNDSEPDNVSKNGIENENETKNEKESKNEIEKKSAKVIETER